MPGEARTPDRRGLQAVWLAIGSSAASALVGALVHFGATRFDWRLLVLARAFAGVLFSWAIVRTGGVRLAWPGDRALWMVSGSAALTLVAFFFSLTGLPVADAIVLRGMAPVWVALASALLLGQRLGLSIWLSCGLGFTGLILLQGPHFQAGQWAGSLAGLASGVFLAVTLMTLRRVRHYDPRFVILHYSVATLIAAIVAILAWPAAFPDLGELLVPGNLAIAGGVAIIATLSTLALAQANRLASPATVSALTYTSVGIAALIDVLVLGRVLDLRATTGLVLACLPAALVTLAKRPRWELFEGQYPDPGLQVDEAFRQTLEEGIRQAEQRTSCEFRIHVEPGSQPLTLARAEALFDDLGMRRTRLRNGLLIVLQPARQALTLAADAGLVEVMGGRHLRGTAVALAGRVSGSDPAGALSEGLMAVAGEFGRYFPWQLDDVNELPDTISMGV